MTQFEKFKALAGYSVISVLSLALLIFAGIVVTKSIVVTVIIAFVSVVTDINVIQYARGYRSDDESTIKINWDMANFGTAMIILTWISVVSLNALLVVFSIVLYAIWIATKREMFLGTINIVYFP